MGRYPVGLYPGWLRLVMTWIVPVGVMTTVPAQALTGEKRDFDTEIPLSFLAVDRDPIGVASKNVLA